MRDLEQLLAGELSLKQSQVQNALQLLREGGTVPFIARYRKERTEEMDEVQLHALFDRYAYLTELGQRKKVILESIEKQGKLTDELRAKITDCVQKTELEDLYLPFRPKKRTRASVARDRGLEPLADFLKSVNTPEVQTVDLEQAALPFVAAERGVATTEEALAGAADIIAEEIAEKAEHRGHLREYLLEQGVFVSRIAPEHPAGSTKYEMYRDFKVKTSEIHPHNMLALLRGEKDGVVTFDLTFDQAQAVQYLVDAEVHAGAEAVRSVYRTLLADAFERLLRPSLVGEVRALRKELADRDSITTFEANLRELLLSAPAGMKPTMGMDPGFRTGCKVVVLDATGKLIEHCTIYPHRAEGERQSAAGIVRELVSKHHVELIAIGNGTGGRETEEFIHEVLKEHEPKPVFVIVNESGASVYSASPLAREEFPDLDLTVRGAISIGRRLQDPLAELVKIDPKSIGVGQYQHDVDQRLLRKRLEETVQSCVNFVGVDVNMASRELLKYVAGINAAAAKNIVAFRDEHGAFKRRDELKSVPKLGPRTFEQAAGFLRIRGGENPLDNSAVHPESYDIAEKILQDLGLTLEEAVRQPARLKAIEMGKYVTARAGEPTIRDIIAELQKPGRDPRAEFHYAHFKEGVKEIKDLTPGMDLEGVVTNVTNFGAFVDIGVHQDGLVHVSQIADRFVQDPKTVVHVGQVVKVRVLEVNEQLKRISLTMKMPGGRKAKQESVQDVKKHGRPGKPGKPGESRKQGKPGEPARPGKPAPQEPRYTVEDLRQKFKNR